MVSAGGAWLEPVISVPPHCLEYSMAHGSIQEIVALLLEMDPASTGLALGGDWLGVKRRVEKGSFGDPSLHI